MTLSHYHPYHTIQIRWFSNLKTHGFHHEITIEISHGFSPDKKNHGFSAMDFLHAHIPRCKNGCSENNAFFFVELLLIFSHIIVDYCWYVPKNYSWLLLIFSEVIIDFPKPLLNYHPSTHHVPRRPHSGHSAVTRRISAALDCRTVGDRIGFSPPVMRMFVEDGC